MSLAVGTYSINVTTATQSGNVTASGSGVVTVAEVYALNAPDIQSTTEVSSPSITSSPEIVAFNPDSVAANAEVLQPSMGQTHFFTASDLGSSSQVSSPAIKSFKEADDLTATSISAASEVSVPVLTNLTDNLLATSIQASSQVSVPAMTSSNEPTLVQAIPNQSAVEGEVFNLDLDSYFLDADTYSISGLPSGTDLSLDSNNGVLYGTLASGDIGYSALTVTATNIEGSVSDSFGFTVFSTEADANIDWPYSLPQSVLIDDFESELPEGSIRVDMDSGPAFQRQRYTAAPEQFSTSFIMSREQLNTFLTFYKTSTAHGSLPFNWKHPITGAPAKVQFVVGEQPTYEILSHRSLKVSAVFEVLS